MAKTKTKKELGVPPSEMKVLVVGAFVYGFGDTVAEAVKNMKKNGRTTWYHVYVCHPATTVYQDGTWGLPPGDFGGQWAPKKMHTVGLNKDGKPKKKGR